MQEGHPGSKESLRIQSAHLFCCSRSLEFEFSETLKSCLKQFYIAPYHVVSEERAVAMAVPIENPADCEVWGAILFLRAGEILGYLAEKTSSRVELLCCTTMHVRPLSGRHKPCCVSNSVGTSSRILHTFPTWHLQSFSCFQKWSTLLERLRK